MRVSQFCVAEVVSVGTDTEINAVARLMRTHHVGAVVVVTTDAGGGRPSGIVTDRDLVVEVLAQDAPAGQFTVGDIMTPQPATVQEDDDLWEAVACMAGLGVRRLPVVDDLGYLRGIIALDDLIEWFSASLEKLRRVIGQELRREVRQRR